MKQLTDLIIVESSGKIKKIKEIVGPKYEVVACYSHIVDLSPNKLSIDINNNYEPQYELKTSNKGINYSNILKDLKKKKSESKMVYLATDLDREGEAIAYNLKNYLNLKNYKRIKFNEITNSPRQILLAN